MQRPTSYPPSPATAYRVHMSNTGAKSSWARYIKEATERDGWSGARLARESGVNRTTIYRWTKDEGGNVTVDRVRRIALALGDDPDEALRHAGNIVESTPAEAEDEEVALIMRAPVDDGLRQVMLSKLYERRERDRQRRIEDFQTMIDLANRGEG